MERVVKLKNYFSYGLGDFYGGGSFSLIGMLLLIFLTDQVGLNPILAGLVFGLGRFWDALVDPCMGFISDNKRSKFGRRRVFFLIGIIPIFVSFVPLWIVPFHLTQSNQLVGFSYYLVVYLFFNTMYSMVVTPYASLVADMSSNYKVRMKLSAFRMGTSQLASSISGIVAPIIIFHFTNPRTGYLIMALSFGIVYSIIWFVVYKGTWENKLSDNAYNRQEKFEPVKIMRNFASVIKNKSFRIHICMYLLAFTALDGINSFLAYFLKYYLNAPHMFPYATGAFFTTQIIVLPIYVKISNRIGTAVAYRVGLVIFSIGLIMCFTLTPANVNAGLIFAIFCLMGAGFSSAYMVPMAILPSVSDVDEMITTVSRTGTYAGAMSLLRKSSQGLIILPGVGILLSAIHYVPDHVQTFVVQTDIRDLFIMGPLLFAVGAFAASLFFKINARTHGILRAEIDRLAKGGLREDVGSETRSVCEMLTGIKYQNLYTVDNIGFKKKIIKS